jgi:hypothetical protein
MLANTLWLEGRADRAALEVPYAFADAATEIRNDDISVASAISRSSSWHGFRPYNSPSDPARDTASVRVPTPSFRKMRLTCDFTVSGEILSN